MDDNPQDGAIELDSSGIDVRAVGSVLPVVAVFSAVLAFNNSFVTQLFALSVVALSYLKKNTTPVRRLHGVHYGVMVLLSILVIFFGAFGSAIIYDTKNSNQPPMQQLNPGFETWKSVGANLHNNTVFINSVQSGLLAIIVVFMAGAFAIPKLLTLIGRVASAGKDTDVASVDGIDNFVNPLGDSELGVDVGTDNMVPISPAAERMAEAARQCFDQYELKPNSDQMIYLEL